MQLQVKYQSPIRRTICPVCSHQLEDTERGLHCPMGDWQEMPQYKYIPRTPETTE